MCELLWSDPQPQEGRNPSKRGIGVQFGPDVTRRFLEDNGLELLVRSHEVRLQALAAFHATSHPCRHAEMMMMMMMFMLLTMIMMFLVMMMMIMMDGGD